MTERTSRQPRVQDVEALIGLLAHLESVLRDTAHGADPAGQSAEAATLEVGRVRERLARHGLVDPDADVLDIALAVGNLNQRLRFVLGEYASEDEGES